MGSLRRTILAGTGTIIAGIVGAWSVLSDRDEDTSPQSGENNTTGNTSTTDNATRGGNASRDDDTNQSDLPEAANPEANPEVETNDSVIAEPGEVENTEPTKADIEIADGNLTTSQRGAVLTLPVTNTADMPVIIDLEVAFLADGKRLTATWGGVTGLKPGKSATIECRVRGEQYAKATDYRILTKEISPTVTAG